MNDGTTPPRVHGKVGPDLVAVPPGHGVYLCCVTPPEEGVDGCPNCGNHDSYRFILDKPEEKA